MSDDSEVEADMVTNTDDEDQSSLTSSSEESSLEGVFNKNFETLREIYKKQTGQDLPQPSSFEDETTLVVRGKEKSVRSSVPFDSLKTSSEGEMRGVYIVSDDMIRYFFYSNMGDNPSEFNAYSLRVVKPRDEERGIWAEMRISTMPSELAGKIMSPSERMERKRPERGQRGERGGMRNMAKKMEEEEDNDEEVIESEETF